MSKVNTAQYGLFVLTALTLFGVAGCSDRQASSDPSGTLTTLSSLTYAPVSTFRRSCMTCHTPQTQWFSTLLPQRKRSLLLPKVKTMMEQEAYLEPIEKDIEAMAAYCRALSAEEPFVCVLSLDPGLEASDIPVHIQGEATPYATVRIGQEETQADGSGSWEFTSCVLSKDRTIEATKDDKTSRLSLLTTQWSHDR